MHSSLFALLEANSLGPGAGRSQIHNTGSKPEGRRDSSRGLTSIQLAGTITGKHEVGAKEAKLNLFVLGYTLTLSFLTPPEQSYLRCTQKGSIGLGKMLMGQRGHNNRHQRNLIYLITTLIKKHLKSRWNSTMWRECVHCNLNTICQMNIKPLYSVVSYPLAQEGFSFTDLHRGIPGSRTPHTHKSSM